LEQRISEESAKLRDLESASKAEHEKLVKQVEELSQKLVSGEDLAQVRFEVIASLSFLRHSCFTIQC
jgi:hypothetical protein